MGSTVYFKIIRLVAALSFILLLIGCGGGGGGGSSLTPEDTTFKIFPEDHLVEGYQSSATLTGSDTAGGRYTASISSQTGSSAMFNGVSAIPLMEIIDITNTTTRAFVTISETGYYSDNPGNRELLGIVIDTTGDVLYASSTSIIPQWAKIGDLGTIGSFIGNNGNTINESWRLTNANNGLANMVVSATEIDLYGNVKSYTDITSVIDQDGKTHSVVLRIYFVAESVTMTLSGK